uniref:Uncharacterized protein n=1 Tax=Haptolina brevifila TaxID=156173 RepID=A0A7S2DJX1_9EUKA|mmetsp:Transcript_39870/g.79770  ORF Transcript_39870/g.79770 Transcript_39870/m.79770 type:complete len:117 (+) Transcript_39870:338-688(+)
MTTDNFLFATASVALALVSVHQAALGLRYTILLWHHGDALRCTRHADRLRPANTEMAQGIPLHDTNSTAAYHIPLGVPITTTVDPRAPVRRTNSAIGSNLSHCDATSASSEAELRF